MNEAGGFPRPASIEEIASTHLPSEASLPVMAEQVCFRTIDARLIPKIHIVGTSKNAIMDFATALSTFPTGRFPSKSKSSVERMTEYIANIIDRQSAMKVIDISAFLIISLLTKYSSSVV